ncbi:hypothetical protein B0J13DRAFT_536899 [Dactylonectria estremocensis]|uniref:Transfer RNA methyltransferase 82 n=1 Tax=Dactylonectria estremocensis TaxID=1079267 RepID=A0A9P9FKJ8_9HYPO|nr:hypothetical protein B0J13DRAFT_536899 [Dactylonectria estremocensis]
MKIPYNVLHASGNVLFAARGGKLHSFDLNDGTHLSTWKHLDVDKVDAAVKTIANEAERITQVISAPQDIEGGDNDEPPAKRQKTEEPKEQDNKTVDSEGAQEPNTAESSEQKKSEGKSHQKGKKGKNKQQTQSHKDNQISRVPDRPVITHLTSTADGAHVLAITGHDKIIWVFEHDGKGQLTQLSQRTMPKRPSSVAIGPDSQVICADKFGDVYALPLIETTSSLSTPQPSTPAPTASKPARGPAANITTVHSRRNRQALVNQQRQMELTTRSKGDAETKAESPNFELTLLLGHVSMLTSLILGESDGRRYILTADRDEHIRVSRYIPQAYVIEGFCFGHKEFISAMTIPHSRPEVLISGGGDKELFLWDWKAAKLLSKTNVLSLAQEIAPGLTKVAVSGLQTLIYPTEEGNLVYVVAICEGIQAIFSWQLTDDNTLNYPSVIQLPGKALDVAFKQASNDETPSVVVAIDAGEQAQVKCLAIYSLIMTDEKLAVGKTSFVNDGQLETEELDVPEKVVQGLLYATENLRKQSTEPGEEQGDDQGEE